MKRIIATILAIGFGMSMIIPVFASSCKHSKTKISTYKTEYVENTDTTHLKIEYNKEVCKKCNKVVERWTEEKEYSHIIDEDVCTKCGYSKQETYIVLEIENNTVYVNNEETEWDYAPKNVNGTTMVPLILAVETFDGEYIDWDSYTSQAMVELNGKIIEYQKNSKKYWIDGKKKTANENAQILNGKLYVELKTLLKVTNQVANYKDGYIVVANNWLSQKEIQEIVDGLFWDISYDNDYNELINDTTYYSDIKAGKIYATDETGIHIYKRTYDPTNELGYDDIYVCTITNFDLPTDEVFTLEGKYLYKDGEKVCANIDILREAEKRINQLNQILAGADNAYNVGTIDKTRRNEIKNEVQDIIYEYQSVMKGSKSLNKVSERQTSYKAKYGQSTATVEKIQQKLYDLGFSSQTVNGEFDGITFNNIAYFQITNDLSVTGWVDNGTYNILMNSSVNVETELEEIQEELNTLPLSAIDIEKGVTVVTIGCNQYYDCTEVLNEVFLRCGEEARQHKIVYPNLFTDFIPGTASLLPHKALADAKNLLWFYSKVDSWKDWDLKRDVSWEITVGTTYPGRNASVIFFGKLYTISELGNLMYGYTGTAMNIPEEILYMGGGFAQTKDLEFIFLEGYGDLEDQPLIKEGIEWYKREYWN